MNLSNLNTNIKLYTEGIFYDHLGKIGIKSKSQKWKNKWIYII